MGRVLGLGTCMMETNQRYKDFLSKTEALLTEVEQLLLHITIESHQQNSSDCSVNHVESNQADITMTSYLRMIEITHILENLLDQFRIHDMAFNGHIDSLIDATDILKTIISGVSNNFNQSGAIDGKHKDSS